MNNNTPSIPLQKIRPIWLMLKLTYGIVPIIAGADKFLNLLTNWHIYINPMLFDAIPVSAVHFMYLIGIIEIIAGIVVLSKYTRYGAYIVMLWLMIISLNLISLGFYDIAVRDVVIAIGALALALLSDLVESR